MLSKVKVWSLLLPLVVLSLVAAQCGARATPAPTPVPPQAETANQEVAQEAMPSIAEIVVESANADTPEFTTLLAAVQAAGLADTLAGEGTFTVFAPTDAAFAALPAGTLDELLADPEGALTDVLLYHVAGQTLMASDVVGLDSAPTLQGQAISIQVEGDDVLLNDTVNVIVADIEASNGVVHVIDAVLVPSSEEMATDKAMEEKPSIAEIVVESANADMPEFTTLLAAVQAAGLADTLAGEGTFTVFAPTDAAFAALPAGTIDELLADPEGALTDVLLYHVAGQTLMASDVVGLDSALTLQGQAISIQVEGDDVLLDDTVKVIATDIEASNGVVHVIDAVLVPSQETSMSNEIQEGLPSIAEIVVESANAETPEFRTLLAAVQAAGLTDTLAGEGTFTVFAPTDAAFAALPRGTLEKLVADPEGALTDVLLYHVAGQTLMASDVVGLDSAPTLQGQAISIQVEGDDVLLNDSVKVIATDIEASNGVVHVIDAVLVPSQEQPMSTEMKIAPAFAKPVAYGQQSHQSNKQCGRRG